MSDEGESAVTVGATTANTDETEEVDFDMNFDEEEEENIYQKISEKNISD